MIIVGTERISIVRGDTLKLTIERIESESGAEYVMSDKDRLKMNIKRSEFDGAAVISKECGSEMLFVFSPEDTECLIPSSEYVFDIRLITEGGEVYTVIPCSKLSVERNITEIR